MEPDNQASVTASLIARAVTEPLINLRRVQELAKLGTKAGVALKPLGELSLSMFGEGKGTLGSLTAEEAAELASALLDMMEAAKKEEGT